MSDCIIKGTNNRNVYGTIRVRGRNTPAHRVAWEAVHGPIPDGMFVCHTCDTPGCVNVEHLFLGTPADNTRDASNKGRLASRKNGRSSWAKKTHCPRGHEYTPENTTLYRGRRYCKACHKVHSNSYAERNREAIRERARKRKEEHEHRTS